MASNRDLGKLTVSLELATAKFEAAAKRSEQQTAALGKALGGISAPLQAAGRNFATLAAGVVSLQTAMAGLRVGAEFEDAFVGVMKTVNASPEEFDKLRTSILNLSTQLPTTATELAGVAQAAGQLGIKTANIAEFTEVMAQLGLATNLSAQEGADALARFANVTGMSQENFDNLASTIVHLGNNMATTEAQITEMAMRLSGVGSQVGMTESQIIGFAATLSSMGIEAEAGGSAFSKLFSEMALAVAKGGDALTQFATVADESVLGFADLFKRDAAEAVTLFIEGLDRLKGDGTGAIKVLDDMGLSEVRLRDATLRVAGAHGDLRKALVEAEKAWAENIALQNETDKRLTSLVSQWGLTKNAISLVAIQLVDSLAPGLVLVLGLARDTIEVWSHMFADSDIKGHGQNLAALADNVKEFEERVTKAKDNVKELSETWFTFNLEARQNAAAENLQKETKLYEDAKKAQDDYKKGLAILNDMETEHATKQRQAQERLAAAKDKLNKVQEAEAQRQRDLIAAQQKAKEAADKYADAIDNLREKLAGANKAVAEMDLKKGFDDAIASMDQSSFDNLSMKMLEGLKRAEREALPEAVRNSKIGEELADQIATVNWTKAMQPLREEFEQVGEDITTAIEESNAFETLRVELAESVAAATEEGFSMADVESFFSDYGVMMMDALNVGLSTLANGGDWGDAAIGAGKALGQSIGNEFLPGLGDAFVTLTEMDYSALFGGKNADTEARQKIDMFLEDILGANLVTGGYIQEGWAETFNELAGNGATAFEAVGTALAVLAGESADYGGQIGYILAENLHGNLEALPMLLDSLGISLEQMAGEFEQIGISGEMSWAQLEVLYAGLDEATNRGIAQVGDLVGAYATLEMSGGRGAMAIEGLRQVAIEAQEAGAQSLEQLQGVMTQLGYSQEEIDRMVSVLQSRGITNMEQLENASTRTLGSIVAGLESAGMQWESYGQGVDSAIEKVTELEQKIMGIQSRDIDINVNVNYETSGEPPKANALGNAFGSSGLIKLAKGGIVTSPTYFNARNYAGVMGEAGAEAVMPLRRTASGELGVIGSSGNYGDITVNVYAPNSQAGVSSEIIHAIKSVHRKSVNDAVNTVVAMHQRGAL